jgi:hypothetical protein
MKIISFIRRSPVSGEDIFGDLVRTFYDSRLMSEFQCRTGPNARQPGTGKTYDLVYGMTALGNYHGTFIRKHEKFGPCILLEDGKEIAAAFPNMNHGGRHVIKAVFVHTAYRDDDPATAANEALSGSAGCLTIPIACSKMFFGQFVDAERVMVEIRGV